MIHPSSLVVNLARSPSAGIQRGGRVGLNAEYNRLEAGLHLRLEEFCPFFLNLELNKQSVPVNGLCVS